MKQIKKALALCLLLSLVLLLAGCGASKNPLEGTWKAELDLAPLLCKTVDDSADLESQGITGLHFSDYLGECKMNYSVTFNSDGTYKQEAEEGLVEKLNAPIKEATMGFYRDVLIKGFQVGLQQGGVTQDVNTEEQLEEVLQTYLGKSIDEAIEMSLGMDLESFVDSVLTEDIWADALEELESEGKYEVKDGKLFMSAGLEYDVDPEVYEEYKLEGNTLTLLNGIGEDEELNEFIYPMTLTKAG